MAIFAPSTRAQPIPIAPSVQGQVYGLVALALALTLAGVWLGMQFGFFMAPLTLVVLLFADMALIFTARLWVEKYPLNYFLFGLFPVFSGFTLTPLLISVVTGYVNGGAILVNALLATTCMVAAAAVAALATGWNLAGLGRTLFIGLIGLIVIGLLQIFIPGLRTGQMEIIVSGAGVLIFAAFIAYDLQRVVAFSREGMSPFLLALHLYLDIFNLFLYVMRFMLATSGRRR